MKWPIKMPWRREPPARRPQRPAPPDWVNARLDTPPPQDDAAETQVCGWFDSSHALNSGLMVTEHLTPERVANEVPLGWWLDWQSRCGGVSAPAGLR